MRCKNCGWDNPGNATKCEKCFAPLEASSSSTEPVSERMRGTVSEKAIFETSSSNEVPRSCPKCGYPISGASTTCPNCNNELQPKPTAKESIICKCCGATLENDVKFCPNCGNPTSDIAPTPKRVQRSSMGTVLGGIAMGPANGLQFCTLKPIAWQGENVNYNPITYSGETIVLNRANTDANNHSITSQEQAILTYEDGEWYIENRSSLRTTYLRINGRVKLTKGDVLVLGNREFEFNG